MYLFLSLLFSMSSPGFTFAMHHNDDVLSGIETHRSLGTDMPDRIVKGRKAKKVSKKGSKEESKKGAKKGAKKGKTKKPKYSEKPQEKEKVYLSLGDSGPAGTSDTDPDLYVVSEPFSSDGYPHKLFRNYLKPNLGYERIFNLACPSESFYSFASGDTSLCYGENPFFAMPDLESTVSQLDSAISIIKEHDVQMITLHIGGNDLLRNCDPADPEVDLCVAFQLQLISVNLVGTLATLQNLTDAPILLQNYYSAYLAFNIVPGIPETLTGLAVVITSALINLNMVLAGVAQNIEGVYTIDHESDFQTLDYSGTPPENARVICENTLMCEEINGMFLPLLPPKKFDIHANSAGHKKMADLNIEAIKSLF